MTLERYGERNYRKYFVLQLDVMDTSCYKLRIPSFGLVISYY